MEAYIGDMFTIRAVLAYMVYLCKNRMLAPEIFESPLLAETALRFAFYCGVVAVAWSCGGLAALFWFWVVPLVTAANLIGGGLQRGRRLRKRRTCNPPPPAHPTLQPGSKCLSTTRSRRKNMIS